MYSIYQEMKVFHRQIRSITTHDLLKMGAEETEKAGRILSQLEHQFDSPLRQHKLFAFLGEYSGLKALTAALGTFVTNDTITSRIAALLEEIFATKRPESLTRYDYTKNWCRWSVDQFTNDIRLVVQRVSPSVGRRLTALVDTVQMLKISDEGVRKEMLKLVSLVRLVRQQSRCGGPLKASVTQLVSLFSWVDDVHAFVKWEVYFVLMDLMESCDPLTLAADPALPNYQSVHPLVLNTLLCHYDQFRCATLGFVDVVLVEIESYAEQCRLQGGTSAPNAFCCDENPPTTWSYYFNQQQIDWPAFPPFPKLCDHDLNVENYLETLHRFLRDPLRPRERDGRIFNCLLDYLMSTPEPFLIAAWEAFKTLLCKLKESGSSTSRSCDSLDTESPIDFENVFKLNVPLQLTLRVLHATRDDCCQLHHNLQRLVSAVMDNIRQQARISVDTIRDLLTASTATAQFRSSLFLNVPLIFTSKEILRHFLVDHEGLDSIFEDFYDVDEPRRRNAATSLATLAAVLGIQPFAWPSGDDGLWQDPSLWALQDVDLEVQRFKDVFLVELNSPSRKKPPRKSIAPC